VLDLTVILLPVCISIPLGLLALFGLALAIGAYRRRTTPEDVKSSARLHWQYAPEQCRVWAELKRQSARVVLRRVASKPFTWVLVVLIVLPALILPGLAYLGAGWWLALLSFALLMIVPFTFFFAYRWLLVRLFRSRRLSRLERAEVWIGPKGVCDSLGFFVPLKEDRRLVRAELRPTAYGPALYLEIKGFLAFDPDMFSLMSVVYEIMLPVPLGKEGEAKLTLHGL